MRKLNLSGLASKAESRFDLISGNRKFRLPGDSGTKASPGFEAESRFGAASDDERFYGLRNLRGLGNILLEVVFPENLYCITCKTPIKKSDRYSLCPKCKEEMLFRRPPSCPRCGSFISGKVGSFCETCAAHEPVYDRAEVAVVYTDRVKSIIYRLKYGGKTWLAGPMAEIMSGVTGRLGDFDIIVPVPLHPSKQRARGFCQTTLISKTISGINLRPLVSGNLVRIKKTRPMSGLTADERVRNLSGAFKVLRPEEFRGKRILLVDDLLTTGTTANACAALLKEAGAAAVYVAAFASPQMTK